MKWYNRQSRKDCILGRAAQAKRELDEDLDRIVKKAARERQALKEKGFHRVPSADPCPPLACNRCGALVEEGAVDKHRAWDNLVEKVSDTVREMLRGMV